MWKYDLSFCVSKDEVDFPGKRLKKPKEMGDLFGIKYLEKDGISIP